MFNLDKSTSNSIEITDSDYISDNDLPDNRINLLAQEHIQENLPPPITFLRSKRIGVWLLNKVFGTLAERRKVSPWRISLFHNRNAEEISFTTADGLTLHGNLFKGNNLNPEAKTYIYCSGSFGCYEEFVRGFGNDGDSVVEGPGILQKLLEEGHQVFLFDYRGFGDNRELSAPSVQGLRYDVEAAYNSIIEKGVMPEDIVMYGYSLGAPLAAEVAAKHGTDLILDRPLLDTGTSAKETIPIFGFLAKWVIGRKFPLSTTEHLRNFSGENLRIILGDDEVQYAPSIILAMPDGKDQNEYLRIHQIDHYFSNNASPSEEFLNDILF